MGLSLSRIYSSLGSLAFWGKDKEVRILMVGLDSAGKTTILYRLQVGHQRIPQQPCQPRLGSYPSCSSLCYPADQSLSRRSERSCRQYQVSRKATTSNLTAHTLAFSYRLQRRDGIVQEHQLPSVGSRRTVEYSTLLEVLLRQHAGQCTFLHHNLSHH